MGTIWAWFPAAWQPCAARNMSSRRRPAPRAHPPTRSTLHLRSARRSVGVLIARGWNPNDPVDARIEALRQRITETESRLDELTKDVSRESAERKAAIADVERKLHAEIRKLNETLEKQERDATVLDARGLPSVAIGIVLSGVPEDLARIPWHIGWILPVIGAAAAILAIVSAVRSRPRA